MKEYKIVCDMKIENVRTGEIKFTDCTAPWISGSMRMLTIYTNKAEIEKELENVISECAKFDQYTRDKINLYGGELVYTQTNIRIVSRTVTEWT